MQAVQSGTARSATCNSCDACVQVEKPVTRYEEREVEVAASVDKKVDVSVRAPFPLVQRVGRADNTSARRLRRCAGALPVLRACVPAFARGLDCSA